MTGQQQGPRHLRDRLLRLPDLQNLPPVQPLIEGLLYRNTLAQLAGPPGCYKSFAAIAMSCALAAGKSFGDFAVPRAGTVIYVAAEGASGLVKRVLAWCEVWGVDVALVEEQLFFVDMPLQLGDEDQVAQAVEVVTERCADLLVLDTRARCTVGLDENSATQQGLAIDAADSIRAAAGCTVFGVHHSSRTGTAGRGSNAWDGAVWSDLRMEGGGLQATVHCEKHKDVPAGCDHHFALVPHTVSPELMPDTFPLCRSTLVISNASTGLQMLRAKSQCTVLDIIWNSAPPEGFTPSQVIGLAAPLEVGKSSVYQALKVLAEQGLIKNIGTARRSRFVAGEQRP
ncbi:AAA family ATPase [Mycobacterium sp. E3339]|uniref:AAA family ATPase n=1 Tax=Mycobacterium sp. E3339 TaxID=1834146 RepID=UPI00082B6E2C|nr:AAA family ATPase [Mycobacterium sp. E3339]